MSLRDWFAGQDDVAVAYDLLHREGCEELIGEPMPEDMLGMVKWRLKVVAALRFLEADAMLAARASAKPVPKIVPKSAAPGPAKAIGRPTNLAVAVQKVAQTGSRDDLAAAFRAQLESEGR